jgi:murein DD-endopeptidase MepM/ murein hydrolase activator NlpD
MPTRRLTINLLLVSVGLFAPRAFDVSEVSALSPDDGRYELATGGTTYVYPVMGPRLSSDFGVRRHPIKKVVRHHDGIDLAAPLGAPIRVVAAGTVLYSDPHGGYGRYIVVLHKDGYSSHYGHCQEIKVRPGQKVTAGEIIGSVGNSGISTGPHLHFEIRKNGHPENPERHLPGLAEAAAG